MLEWKVEAKIEELEFSTLLRSEDDEYIIIPDVDDVRNWEAYGNDDCLCNGGLSDCIAACERHAEGAK